MSLTGLFFDRRPSISGVGASFVFDATISAVHSRQWEWTEEPIENGTTISDNRWERPVPFTITVTVSGANATPIDRSAHIKAWDRLAAIASAQPAQLVTIATGRRQYENHGIISISEPEGAAIGDQMLATITTRPIEITRTAVAQNLALAAQDGGLAEENIGTQGYGNENSAGLDLSGAPTLEDLGISL